MIREHDDGSFDIETLDDLREVFRRYREQHPRDVVPRRPYDNSDLDAFGTGRTIEMITHLFTSSGVTEIRSIETVTRPILNGAST